MLYPAPTVEEAALAVARAAAARRARHSGNPVHAKLSADEIAEAAQAVVDTAAAIAAPLASVMPSVWNVVVYHREGVTGTLQRPRQGRDDWQLVGYVDDRVAGDTFDVWYAPRARRVGIGRSKPLNVTFTVN